MNVAARLAIAKCDGCDADTLRDYIRAGLVLVPIPAGSKAPRGKGWNLHGRCWAKPGQVPDTYSGNVGLAHAYAGTCALDIDAMTRAGPALAAHGIDLAALLSASDAVHIRSGREGRDKLLYRLPAGVTLASINRSAAEGFELRCAATNGRTVQDVLPPSIHPDTGRPYQWAGNWRAIPNAPAGLLTAWRGMLGTSPAPRTLPQPTRTRRALPKAIPEGERNTTLLSRAAGFVRKGLIGETLNKRMQRINAERCAPPLGADEVDAICARATAYGSDGILMLPHKLLDSPGWRALSLPAKELATAALRRAPLDGTPFALPFSDFCGLRGFRNSAAFSRHRSELVRAEFLRIESKGRRSQHGVLPAMFTVPDAARQGSLRPQSALSETDCRKVRYGHIPPLALRPQSAHVGKALTGVCGFALLAVSAKPETGDTQTLAALCVLLDNRPQQIASVADYYAVQVAA